MIAKATLLSLVTILSLAALPSTAETTSPTFGNHSCFFVSQFENWKSPDPKTIYIRVGMTRFYRLDLSARCSELSWPGAYLITRFRGSDSICTALDWDIKVVDSPNGIPTSCIVKTMTELTPAEAAAIPRKSKP